MLQRLDLPLPAGRWSCIVGPNGAGKSTLLKALAGLLPLRAGRVELLGRDLHAWPRRERARQLAWLGQNEAAADDLTVYDVVMLGRLPHQGFLQPASDQDRAAVEQALRATQAWDWRERPLSQLSGGERQRVAIARAIVTKPVCILADEPTGNLDKATAQGVFDIFLKLARDEGTAIVIVTHDEGLAARCDRILRLDAGVIREA